MGSGAETNVDMDLSGVCFRDREFAARILFQFDTDGGNRLSSSENVGNMHMRRSEERAATEAFVLGNSPASAPHFRPSLEPISEEDIQILRVYRQRRPPTPWEIAKGPPLDPSELETISRPLPSDRDIADILASLNQSHEYALAREMAAHVWDETSEWRPRGWRRG